MATMNTRQARRAPGAPSPGSPVCHTALEGNTMEHHLKSRTSGISLIEALIALAVLAFGILAIARLHGEMTASTADSKARAEAMQIAESRVDRLRNQLEVGEINGERGFRAAVSGLEEEGIEGVNATFDVSVDPDIDPDSVLDPDADGFLGYAHVGVTVSWRDARDEDQSVTARSVVTWNDPLWSINLARGRLPGKDLIGSPSGAAREPGDLIESEDAEVVRELHGGDYEIREDDEGRSQLVDVHGDEDEALLETSSPGFSTISGLLLAYDMDADELEDLRVDLSDSGYCVNIPLLEGGPPGATEPDHPHYSHINGYYYRCYVGLGWFGNVGVVNLDGGVSDMPNDVCVGDPSVDETDHWDSREPVETLRRRYRGYDGERAYGIGEGPDMGTGVRHLGARHPDDAPEGIRELFNEPELYGEGEEFDPDDDVGHYFLLADIDGKRTCKSKMEATMSDEEPGHDVTWFKESDSVYAGNSGENYCFLSIDPIGGDCEVPLEEDDDDE